MDRKWFISSIKQLVAEIIISPLARIIAEYVTPENPTDEDIGFYNIMDLIPFVESPSDTLHAACIASNIDMAEHMIRAGARTSLTTKMIGKQGNIPLIKLFNNYGVNMTDAYYEAITFGQLEALHYLLDSGWGNTQNAIASSADADGLPNNAITIIESLIERKDCDLSHALKVCCIRNYTTLINKLLERGANTSDGLLGACISGHIDLTYQLIEKGADPNSGLDGAIRAYRIDVAAHMVKKRSKSPVYKRSSFIKCYLPQVSL